MRRNLAQSLFQYGQIETTLPKAKEVRPFVERLITLARQDTLARRQRVVSLLCDRAVISKDDQEKYDAMSSAQQSKVLRNRSGRRHRLGLVPASYNKKKIPFVARSVVDILFKEIAPKYANRQGGYTRIIRLAASRIGDNSDLALLQLVGSEEAPDRVKKTVSPRRRKAQDRTAYLEGKAVKRRSRSRSSAKATGGDKTTPPASTEAAE